MPQWEGVEGGAAHARLKVFDVEPDKSEDEAAIHHAEEVVEEERERGVKALHHLEKEENVTGLTFISL